MTCAGQTRISVTLTTHTAMRCNWAAAPLRAPGVTARDIRLAVLLERLYTSHFGGGVPRTLPPLTTQPPLPVVHKLLNVPARKLPHYCSACGTRHAPDGQCAAQDGKPPPTIMSRRLLPVCGKCHRAHAPMAMCPKTRDVFVDMPPQTGCPNCGGHHWLQDCRKPQIPPEEAKAMMLPLKTTMPLEE
ncbi:hypothetical protein C0992_003599 [Termitomyces sp. T32_za158]|nr:hypothetical protein C0992_003599 [Termitomyces sp. T32_za158]